MADLATAEVSLEVDFDTLEQDVKNGLERRVRRAARAAQDELDDTSLAAAALGDTINRAVGGQAERASKRLVRAAQTSAKELTRAGRTGAAAGDQIAQAATAAAHAVEQIAGAAEQADSALLELESSQVLTSLAGAAGGAGESFLDLDRRMGRVVQTAGNTARAVHLITDAARGASDALFEIDDDGLIRLTGIVEAVQTSLFDLDTVELERGAERARTFGQRLRDDLGGALLNVRAGVGVTVRNIESGFSRAAGAVSRVIDVIGEVEPATARPARGIGRVSANLISLVAIAATLAPALAAGGAGVAAFVALAVPGIARVIAAQTEMAARWDSLSEAEQVAAGQTKGLIDDYKALSAALTPDALLVYNGAVANLQSLLPRFQPLFRGVLSSLRDANQEIGAGFDSARAESFFAFLTAEAGPAVQGATTLLIDFAAAAASLIQAIAPLAGAGVGLLTFLANLITLVGDVSPELLQFAVALIALRGPLASLGTLFTNIGNRAKGFAKETRGATLASRALSLASAGVPGLVLAGAAALVVFASSAAKAKTDSDQLAASINAQNKAVGNNLQGYLNANKVFEQRLAPAYARVNTALADFQREQSGVNREMALGAQISAGLSEANRAYFQAQERNNAAIANIRAGSQALGEQYGITAGQAIQLADAVGVNLSRSISNNGTVTASVIDKVNAYRTAVALANDPTAVIANSLATASNEALTLEDRIRGLTDAYNAAFNPTFALFQAQNRYRETIAQTAKVMNDSKATQNDRNAAFERSLSVLYNMAQAEFAAEQNVDDTTAAFESQRKKLQDMAGQTDTGREALALFGAMLADSRAKALEAGNAVDDFGGQVDSLPKGKTVKIAADTAAAAGAVAGLISTVQNANPVLNVVVRATGGAVAGLAAGLLGGRAAGGPIAGVRRFGRGGRLRGPGTGTSDSIPALVDGGAGGMVAVSTGEYVINARSTKRYGRLIELINRGALAAGGLVGGARLAAGGAIPGYATGGAVVSRRSLVDIGALLGGAITAGLRGSRAAVAKEADKIRKTLEGKIVAIGQTVGTGFADRITGSASEVNSAFTSLQRQITRAFTGIRTAVDDRLVDRLGRLNDRLQTLANRRDALVDQLEEANRLAVSVTDRTASFAQITGFDDAESASAESIAATLRNRLDAIRRFQRDIVTLTRRGVDEGIIAELAEAGPEAGAALARTLAEAGSASLAQINALQKQINTSSTRFGRDTADLLFDAGAAAGKGFLTGLSAQRKEIVALMTEIARSVAKTVKTTLKIKSPSRVMADLADDTMLGYIDRVEALGGRVRAAVAAAVRPDRATMRAAALEPATATRAPSSPAATSSAATPRPIQQINNFHQVIADPAQIIAVTENRLVAALRGA